MLLGDGQAHKEKLGDDTLVVSSHDLPPMTLRKIVNNFIISPWLTAYEIYCFCSSISFVYLKKNIFFLYSLIHNGMEEL